MSLFLCRGYINIVCDTCMSLVGDTSMYTVCDMSLVRYTIGVAFSRVVLVHKVAA